MTTAAVSLPPPRRKARVREVPGAALPLPSALPNLPCTHYEATYAQGCITICDPRQAAALWHNGYFGHRMMAGGNGRPKGRKKWRLVEADGLKSRKWFKENYEAGRRKGGKGGVEERGEKVEKTVDEMNEVNIRKEEEKEELVDMKEEKKEEEEDREGQMKECEGYEEMEEVKEENTDKEEKKIINVKEDKTAQEREKEKDKMKESQNMEMNEALNIGKDEGNMKEEEKKEEEAESDDTNKTTTLEQPIEELEESDEDFMNNCEGEMETGNDSEEHEPWRTVLTLPADQEGTADPRNPHTYLTLLPEEALFLSYALGCLVLTYEDPPENRRPGKRGLGEQHTHEMTIDEMWRVFRQDDPTFPVKYAAYHHFRTQGWVVKAGLKYGVDYVLYPVGPPFYHSQYAVKVHSVWADTLTLDHSLPGHAMTWTTIATTERLANHINKTPVICFVLRPRSLTRPRLDLIECLRELKVQEMVLGRWNPTDGSG